MQNRERSARKWFLALIIGPAIFFIVYWIFAVNGPPGSPGAKNAIPGDYNEAGKTVQLDSIKIQAGLPNRNIFIQTIQLSPSNKAIAKTGHQFLIIPVFTEGSNLNGKNLSLIDSQGGDYAPLGIKQKYQARAAELEDSEIPPGKDVYYYSFKVDTGVEGYYLVINSGAAKSAWYFKNNSS